MNVRIKPLKTDEFELAGFEPTSSILEIKQRINAEMGDDFPVENLKLIIKGKIMKDDEILQDIGYEEGKSYFVLVVTKKKSKPAAAAAAPVATTTTTQVPANADGNQPAAAGGALVTNAAVQGIVAMGFAEEDVRAALAAAFGNPNRAVEYLTNPELMQAALARNQTAMPPMGANMGPPVMGNTYEQQMQAFRNSPSFPEIRQRLQNNPAAIGTVLQGLQNSYPAIYAHLDGNEERVGEFVDSILQDEDENNAGATPAEEVNPFAQNPNATQGDTGGGMAPQGQVAPSSDQMMRGLLALAALPPEERTRQLQQLGLSEVMYQQLIRMALAGGLPGMGGGRGGEAGPPPPQNTIQLTEAENQAIGRLQELGFSRAECVQAYIACDKNEELAANFLFSNPPEEVPPPPNNNADQNNDSNSQGGPRADADDI